MTSSPLPGPPRDVGGRVRRRSLRWWLLGAAVVATVLIVGSAIVVRDLTRPVPAFPSLADDPDPSLHGTVAYVDAPSQCVRIVATAGSPSKELLCLPPLDPADAKQSGKPIGPQLVWLDGGRLEITMFRMADPPGPTFRRGWQKVVDVRTGAVTETPAADVPTSPVDTARPTVSPTGAAITFTSDPESGHVTITLTDATGSSRSLLDVRGPGGYAYGLNSAFWSPDFAHVLANDDRRILVITTDDPPIVRVLANDFDDPFDDTRYTGIAAAADDLLGPTG